LREELLEVLQVLSRWATIYLFVGA
jgi:hypothetical protein